MWFSWLEPVGGYWKAGMKNIPESSSEEYLKGKCEYNLILQTEVGLKNFHHIWGIKYSMKKYQNTVINPKLYISKTSSLEARHTPSREEVMRQERVQCLLLKGPHLVSPSWFSLCLSHRDIMEGPLVGWLQCGRKGRHTSELTHFHPGEPRDYLTSQALFREVGVFARKFNSELSYCHEHWKQGKFNLKKVSASEQRQQWAMSEPKLRSWTEILSSCCHKPARSSRANQVTAKAMASSCPRAMGVLITLILVGVTVCEDPMKNSAP